MFSSDAFVPDVFLPSAPRVAARPAILASTATAGTSWLPDALDALDPADVDAFADVRHAYTPDAYAPNARAPLSPRETQLQELRVQAQQEAEAALHEALAEREIEEHAIREQLQADAYAAGIAAGRAEAESAAHDALASAVQALWLATEEVRAGEARWHAALEDNVAALVAGAARHVIAREVSADDTLIRTLAARAVAEYPQDHPVHVRVHPADLVTLKTAFAGSARAGELRWTADARVERGGCIVEGRERIVDGRVDTALERVYRTLSGHHA